MVSGVLKISVMGSAPVTEMGLVEDANSTVVATVKNTPGATTYAAFSATRGQDGIVEVSLNGIRATDNNVEAGKYPFWSYEHMLTNGPPSADAARFIAFVESRSDLVRSLGYLTMRDMKTVATDR